MVPTSLYTMDKHGYKQVEICGATDKRQITADFACSSFGFTFLPELSL